MASPLRHYSLILIFAIWLAMGRAQPHPYDIGYTVTGAITCPDGSHCSLKALDVVLELFYYPVVCATDPFNTTLVGDCSLHGNYTGTRITQRALNKDLPFTEWCVNFFEGNNPILPAFPWDKCPLPNQNVAWKLDNGCTASVEVIEKDIYNGTSQDKPRTTNCSESERSTSN